MFKGWDKIFNVITSDLSVTAMYEKEAVVSPVEFPVVMLPVTEPPIVVIPVSNTSTTNT
jgi:hypothetical protein